MITINPLLPDKVYHIYNHANGDENLFRAKENYRYFLTKYSEYIYPVADTYAYCLMPNHFHLMVRIRKEEELLAFVNLNLQGFKNLEGLVSQQFSNLFNSYTKSYNKMYERKGSLFIPRFKRKIVEDENYFTQLIAYIHLNPVRHGFCEQIDDWEFSSFHAYYENKSSKINRKYLQDWFGNRTALLEFHRTIKPNESLFEF